MTDKILVTLGEDHTYECPVDILGREGEGNITRIEITIPDKLHGYSVYLDFELSNGETFRTQQLEIENSVAGYNVEPYILADRGEIKVQAVLQKDDKTWKSSIKKHHNQHSINAYKDIPEKQDFITATIEALFEESFTEKFDENFNERLVQKTGDKVSKVMSQWAVDKELAKKADTDTLTEELAKKVDTDTLTEELAKKADPDTLNKKVDVKNVVQELGNSESKVMSQKAVTTAIENVTKEREFPHCDGEARQEPDEP